MSTYYMKCIDVYVRVYALNSCVRGHAHIQFNLYLVVSKICVDTKYIAYSLTTILNLLPYLHLLFSLQYAVFINGELHLQHLLQNFVNKWLNVSAVTNNNTTMLLFS